MAGGVGVGGWARGGGGGRAWAGWEDSEERRRAAGPPGGFAVARWVTEACGAVGCGIARARSGSCGRGCGARTSLIYTIFSANRCGFLPWSDFLVNYIILQFYLDS